MIQQVRGHTRSSCDDRRASPPAPCPGERSHGWGVKLQEGGRSAEVDLCAVGGGSGGRTLATYARQLGASVALVERRMRLGGDCLLFGCVPSKALLAAGQAVDAVRRAPAFGADAVLRSVDPAGVFRHVRDVIAAIEPRDSVEHFEGLGVKVILAEARFAGRKTLEADNCRIVAHRFVIASGSSPLIPPIPGLSELSFLTNETIFDLGTIPEHLIVVGAGPMGVEMAQAFRHLGAEVTVLEKAAMLSGEDPELVDLLRVHLLQEGVRLEESAEVTGIEKVGNGVGVTIVKDGSKKRIDGSHMLLAVGRRPLLNWPRSDSWRRKRARGKDGSVCCTGATLTTTAPKPSAKPAG